jgi:RNA polymerase sigma-B factor
VDEVEVALALESESRRHVESLSAGEGDLREVAVVDDPYGASHDRLLLAAGFRTLAPRERRIVHLRFYEGLSQTEIAQEVGLSQVQVSRLLRASLERMRCALEGAARPSAPGEIPAHALVQQESGL